MTAIERTAYPRLKQSHYRQQDLQLYIPSHEENAWMHQQRLTDMAKKVDNKYPNLSELVIDEDGIPTLKKRMKSAKPKSNRLLAEIKSRMPERKLLDILCLTHACTDWAHCFSPLSGSSSKLTDPLAANIVTTFSYGTRMGPAEAERHIRPGINAKN